MLKLRGVFFGLLRHPGCQSAPGILQLYQAIPMNLHLLMAEHPKVYSTLLSWWEMLSRWWFQMFLGMFTPIWKISNLTNVYQMGETQPPTSYLWWSEWFSWAMYWSWLRIPLPHQILGWQVGCSSVFLKFDLSSSGFAKIMALQNQGGKKTSIYGSGFRICV